MNEPNGGIFLRIYIDFDQRNWVKLFFITEFVINKKTKFRQESTLFFFTDITPKFWKPTKNCLQGTVTLSKKQMG